MAEPVRTGICAGQTAPLNTQVSRYRGTATSNPPAVIDHIRPLGQLATNLDELFYHQEQRKVRKDGSVSYKGERFEVAYRLTGQTVNIVVNPHTGKVITVVDEQGETISKATPQDTLANSHRQRAKRPETTRRVSNAGKGPNPVEQACQRHYQAQHFDEFEGDTAT